MPPRRTLVIVVAALWAALLALPFLIASAPCEWRLSAYFYAGLAVLATVTLMPFVLPQGALVASRVGSAVILASGCVVVWLGGLFAANVRIVCRLF